MRKAVADTDPNIEIYRSRTMKEAIRELLFPQRMAGAILGISAWSCSRWHASDCTESYPIPSRAGPGKSAFAPRWARKAVPLLLRGTVLSACYFPARRGASVDPLTALREL